MKPPSKIDDKAMKYLISQGIQPTVENIYKACYSSGAESNGGKQSITEENMVTTEYAGRSGDKGSRL